MGWILVIASMLRATLKRLDHTDYRIFVGHYRNDPATAAAIPHLSMRVRRNMRIDLDWRQRMAGNAETGSVLQ